MTFASGIAPPPGANKPRFHHLEHALHSQRARRPDAVAIASPGLPALTYGQLHRQVERTAQALRAAGIARGDRVALALPPGPSAAVAYLGVACAAQAAPLDPACRAVEFDFYLSDMDAKAVIVAPDGDTLAGAVARAQGRRVLELIATPGEPAGTFDLAPDSQLPADAPHAPGSVGKPPPAAGRSGTAADTAFLMHTSGTTGRPKLVPLTHAIVCTSAHNISLSLDLTEDDRCLNVLPLFHGHGLMGPLLASLWAGGCVVVPAGFDATAFPGWLAEFAPTWYTAVPAVHQAVLGAVSGHPQLVRDCPLRFVRSASSPLPEPLAQALERTLAVPVIDAYGMTEACSIITTNPLPPRPRKPGSVGVSIGNEIATMDERGALLPAGRTGEIVLRGPTVIRGYEHNPTANASAFTRGWFRTGDLGHLDEDGFLFLTGRLKEIINRGGTKISPSEVDEALLAHPSVLEAAAFPLPHATLGEEVGAAIVVREHDDPSDEEIRIFLAGRLAEHKIPRRIFRTTQLPRTTSGKVQRLDLAARVTPVERDAQQAPGTPLQHTIAGIWAELLGTDRFGVHDHFFDVGGNSLLIRRAQVLIREATGREVPVVELFARPTIGALSDYLAEPAGAAPPAAHSLEAAPPGAAPGDGPPADGAEGQQHEQGAGPGDAQPAGRRRLAMQRKRRAGQEDFEL